MKRIFTIAILTLMATMCWAQEQEYLTRARQRVQQGECEKAENNYKVYQNMTNGKRDLELERAIAECKQGKTFNNNRTSESVSEQMQFESRNFTDEELEHLVAVIKEKVKNFQRCVSNLAGSTYSHSEKEAIRDRALSMFIGGGYQYPQAVPTRYGFDTVWHDAVVMGSAPSKNNKNLRKYEPMRTYLTRLISNSESSNYRYRKVEIEYTDIVTIDSYRKIGDGLYVATAHYLQKFSGFRSSDMVKAAYHDYTSKVVTIFIKLIEVNLPNGDVDSFWDVKLGDVDSDDVW